MLSLRNLSRVYRTDTVETTALDGIDLDILAGEFVAIMGPSGCGKSTLLRLIAGIFKPDSGRILYDDVDLRDVPLRERGIGMVFQEGALIPHWESRKSVGFFLSLRQREEEVPERQRCCEDTGVKGTAEVARDERFLNVDGSPAVDIQRVPAGNSYATRAHTCLAHDCGHCTRSRRFTADEENHRVAELPRDVFGDQHRQGVSRRSSRHPRQGASRRSRDRRRGSYRERSGDDRSHGVHRHAPRR